MPTRSISLVTLVVPDYDAAIDFYCGVLGFTLVEDTRVDGDKRWVVVHTAGGEGTGLLLAKAADAGQQSAIGKQAGGRVAFFLTTDDFARDHREWRQAGVVFEEEPRDEAYGTVAVFRDPFGNRWDLIEPRS